MKLTHVPIRDGQKDYRNSSGCELTHIAYALDPSPVTQTDGYLVRCPCHDDATASLSLRSGTKAILVHCFAGCSRDEILAELRNRRVWQARDPKPRGMPGPQSKNVTSVIAAIRRELVPA
jgi:hypothetical protein